MWTDFIVFWGFAVAILGVTAILLPEKMLRLISKIDFPARLWPIAILRLMIGTGLWLVASESRHPIAFQVLAVLLIAAAIALPILGRDRIQKVLEWWMVQPPAIIRGWGVLVTGLGLYLLQSLISG